MGLNLLDLLIGKHKKTSKDTAKDRLQAVLMLDRLNLKDEDLENMRREILQVIARYVDLDRKNLEFDMKKGEPITLVLKAPVSSVSRGVKTLNE